MYNVTLGGLAPTNEIFNVSIWFGNGKTRRLGWFPYSLYSFASDRLPTPRGGLLPPSNGANFTLATGWIGRCASPDPAGLRGLCDLCPCHAAACCRPSTAPAARSPLAGLAGAHRLCPQGRALPGHVITCTWRQRLPRIPRVDLLPVTNGAKLALVTSWISRYAYRQTDTCY